MKDVFQEYLLELRRAYVDGDGTEMSGRPALKSLLDVFGSQHNPVALVLHEPKRAVEKGAPDFKVSRQGMILGYVENKTVGENLTKALKSEQITKYRSLSDNIILTDYLQFIFPVLRKASHTQRNLRLPWRRVASFFGTISMRNCFVRSESTEKVGFMVYSRFFATRSSMSSLRKSLLTPLPRCWPIACFWRS